ncbi:YbbR-like domain-containing protein [bacterium]|nr:YbbR-like domain-containing protein [bacterium]
MKKNRDSRIKFFFAHNALQKFMALACTLIVFLAALHSELSRKSAEEEQTKREHEAAAAQLLPKDAVEKEVDVALAVDGTLPEGSRITLFETFPNRVVVLGTPERLEELESVSTKTVDLSGLTQSVRINVELEIPDNVKVKDNLSVVVASINVARVESLDAELSAASEAGDEKSKPSESEKAKPAEQGK